MDVISKQKMRYDAFISYRHSDLDKFVAEELHKQLETFKVPKNIADKCNKKKINRIFRDKDELPITSNLADPILNALRESEFLIVICSPRLKESLWCKREIENFIEMHGQENVLAVLIEGEPKDSFPEELLYRKKTITLENGETKEITEAIEPLAADVRGKNKKEIKKLIKIEMLRLLASMLQCNFDDLKQRHKERKMHRMLAIAGVICGVGIVFGTVSTVMALRIQEQKKQIDKQYWEALKTNAIMSSDNAMELLETGDRIGAITVARALLPDNLDKQSIPYTAQAFYALTESLYPYGTGAVLKPVYKIKENAQIDQVILSHDWNKLSVRTKYDKMTIWDMVNKEKLLSLDLNKIADSEVCDEGIGFLGEDKIALLTENEVLICNLGGKENDKIMQRISCEGESSPRKILCDAAGKYVVVVYMSEVSVFDAESGEKLSTFHAPENYETTTGEISFLTGDTLILCFDPSLLSGIKEDIKIQIVECQSGNIQKEFSVPYGMVAEIAVNNNYLYVAVNGDLGNMTDIYAPANDADIYCFDWRNGGKCWEYHVEEEFINSILVPYEGYDCFLFESYAQITALEGTTGKLIGTFGFGSSIVDIFPLQTADSYIVFTREGGRVSFMPEKNYNVETAGVFVPATDNIKQVIWGNDFVVSLSHLSKELIVYDWYVDEGAKEIFELDNTVDKISVSDNEKYSVVELQGYQLMVVDNNTNEILGSTYCDSYAVGLDFISKDKIQRVESDKVCIYDLQCNLIEEYELCDGYVYADGVTLKGKYAYAEAFESLDLIQCESNKVVGQLSKEVCGYDENGTYMFSNNGDMCVIVDASKEQCRNYEVASGKLIGVADMNATYIENVCFSEDDSSVYFVFEDGKVVQVDSHTMEIKCEIDSLNYITDVIEEKTVYGEKKYYFYNSNGAYVLGEYDGQLKVEQFIDALKGVFPKNEKYWLTNYKTLMEFPIYTYEEILGKADRICYDNSLWNNN